MADAKDPDAAPLPVAQDHEPPTSLPSRAETKVAQAVRPSPANDEPEPETTALYLRPNPMADEASAEAPGPGFDAATQTLRAQSAALVDSLARGIAEAIAVALRPLVASTVASLLPMILSLGSVPDPVVPAEADVDAQPAVPSLEE